MRSIAEAQREMLPRFRVLPPVRVALTDAAGQVLATDAVARTDLPPFDNSAMDGYAVRWADVGDVAGAAELSVVGESRAGGPPPAALAPASAMRIFTGAPLPAGADTVIMQENAERSGERVRFVEPGKAGRHVRARGSDQRAGEVAIAAGHELGAGEVALLASQGFASVDVHRAPRVAILSTGDELRDIGQAGEPGTIVNTNAYALSVQVREAGGEPWVLPAARDDVDDIAGRLSAALEADVVLSIGGVSVGEYDFVGEAFARVGITTHFHKVAIKPLLFGSHADGTPLVGLPGNPVSAMVTFELFVRPCLLHMRGLRAPYPSPLTATLEHDHRHSPGRTELARARLRVEGGHTLADLAALQGSGALPSMVGVDGLVVLPADQERFEAGCQVSVLPLGARLRQAEPPIP